MFQNIYGLAHGRSRLASAIFKDSKYDEKYLGFGFGRVFARVFDGVPRASMISPGHKREAVRYPKNSPAGVPALPFQSVDDAPEAQIRSAAASPPDSSN